MSGICGWVGNREAADVRKERLARMTGPLTRYGHGHVAAGGADGDALCCVSSRSTRVYHDERLLSVLDGAFYWKDAALKKEAARYGPSRTLGFHFLEQGPDALDAVGGAFSVAIVDRSEQRLFLACDRMGIERLYYSRESEHVFFGSNLASVLAALRARPS